MELEVENLTGAGYGEKECGAPGAYNLGNGRGFSVRDVINAVERVTGLKVPVILAALAKI